VTGWRQEEAAGRPLAEVFRIINENSRAVVESPVARVLRDGVIVGLANHTLLIRKDGSEVPIDDSAAPIRVEGGALLGCVLVFRDVTARRKTERETWESRELLRTTLASIGDAVISTDVAGRIVFVNPVAEGLTGWTQEEAAGQFLDAVFRIIDEQTRRSVQNPAARSLREGVVVGLANHTLLLRKDGSEVPIDDSAAPIRSADGEIVGCVLVFRDVTRRRQDDVEREELLGIAERARGEAESALAELGRIQAIADTALLDLPYEEVLRALVRRVCDAVGSDTCTLLILEEDGLLHVRAAVGLEDEVAARVRVPLGQGFAGGIAKARRPRIWNEVRYDQVISDYIRDKGIRALAGVPLVSADDSVLGVLHVGRISTRVFVDEDIRLLQLTAERVALAVEHAARREAERRGRELAEASNRAKDEFLAMLGHELRNPLAAVRNAVATASLDESRRAASLDIARRQAEQLGRLIDDLLDVARITQGKIALRKERVYLTEILERAIESTRSFIESRGLRLSVTLAAEPVRVDADPARLEQVFVNLLSNAAKYTDAGGRIQLSSQLRGEEVIVRVQDTGIGISAELLPRMWELFMQAERAPDRAQGGLGIGLTVVRRLVEMHGGRVAAHSDGPGKGSQFSVTLPALAVAAEDVRVEKPAASVSQRIARVLLVEDNPDAADSLALLLEVLGHRVRSVYDGVTGLDAARASPPDVMLVDIGLPGMDGYEVAQLVRRDPALKNVVLVALTGYGRDEDKRRAMAAGFDYHLVKPVNPDALQGLVARLAATDPDEPPAIH
jgi:PAS domain S-box-containing protein